MATSTLLHLCSRILLPSKRRQHKGIVCIIHFTSSHLCRTGSGSSLLEFFSTRLPAKRYFSSSSILLAGQKRMKLVVGWSLQIVPVKRLLADSRAKSCCCRFRRDVFFFCSLFFVLSSGPRAVGAGELCSMDYIPAGRCLCLFFFRSELDMSAPLHSLAGINEQEQRANERSLTLYHKASKAKALTVDLSVLRIILHHFSLVFETAKNSTVKSDQMPAHISIFRYWGDDILPTYLLLFDSDSTRLQNFSPVQKTWQKLIIVSRACPSPPLSPDHTRLLIRSMSLPLSWRSGQPNCLMMMKVHTS